MRIWDLEAECEFHRCEGHQLLVASVAWAPDGERIASPSWDGTARVWDAASGRELACDWDRSGRCLASGSKDGTVRCPHLGRHHLSPALHPRGRGAALTRTHSRRLLLFEERSSEGPWFCLSARHPEKPGSALFLPLGGLREVLHRPDKAEAGLRANLRGDDSELEQGLAAHGLSGGISWDGEQRVLP